MQSTEAKTSQNSKISHIKRALKRITDKHSKWMCSCGYVIPKKDVELSGYASGSRGFHVHCPKCGRVVAEYLNKK